MRPRRLRRLLRQMRLNPNTTVNCKQLSAMFAANAAMQQRWCGKTSSVARSKCRQAVRAAARLRQWQRNCNQNTITITTPSPIPVPWPKPQPTAGGKIPCGKLPAMLAAAQAMQQRWCGKRSSVARSKCHQAQMGIAKVQKWQRQCGNSTTVTIVDAGHAHD